MHPRKVKIDAICPLCKEPYPERRYPFCSFCQYFHFGNRVPSPLEVVRMLGKLDEKGKGAGNWK